MPHIHTLPGQHDATASFIIFRTDGDEAKALLLLHKKYKRLLQPGGHIELDENPWQCALREAREETGYGADQLEVLQPHDRIDETQDSNIHPLPFVMNTHRVSDADHFHSDVMYAFVTDQEPAHDIAEDESDDLRWYSYSELQQLDTDELHPNTKRIVLFAFDVCLKKWEAVQISRFGL